MGVAEDGIRCLTVLKGASGVTGTDHAPPKVKPEAFLKKFRL